MVCPGSTVIGPHVEAGRNRGCGAARYAPAMSSQRFTRDEWPAIVDAFQEFFAGMGEVATTSDEVAFVSKETGLSMSPDGTSRSFMPLHQLGARWNEVHFDVAEHVVTLSGDGVTYAYRVPPALLRGATPGPHTGGC